MASAALLMRARLIERSISPEITRPIPADGRPMPAAEQPAATNDEYGALRMPAQQTGQRMTPFSHTVADRRCNAIAPAVAPPDKPAAAATGTRQVMPEACRLKARALSQGCQLEIQFEVS
jgi:hypothetical protein